MNTVARTTGTGKLNFLLLDLCCVTFSAGWRTSLGADRIKAVTAVSR